MSFPKRVWSAIRSAFHPRRRSFAEQLASLQWENRQSLETIAALEDRVEKLLACPRMMITSQRGLPLSDMRRIETAFNKAIVTAEVRALVIDGGLDVWQLVDGEWKPLKIERADSQPPPADFPPCESEPITPLLTPDQVDEFKRIWWERHER